MFTLMFIMKEKVFLKLKQILNTLNVCFYDKQREHSVLDAGTDH